MRNFRLNIDPLDPRSIDEAVKAFDEEVRRIDQNLDALMKHLAEVGAEAARQAYRDVGAIFVSVDVEKETDGYSIIASGTNLLMLEFVSSDDPEKEETIRSSGSSKKSSKRQKGPTVFQFDSLNAMRLSSPTTSTSGGSNQMQQAEEEEDDSDGPGAPARAMQRAYEAIMQELPSAAHRYFR